MKISHFFFFLICKVTQCRWCYSLSLCWSQTTRRQKNLLFTKALDAPQTWNWWWETVCGPVGRTYIENRATKANQLKIYMAVSVSDTSGQRIFLGTEKDFSWRKTSPKKRASKPWSKPDRIDRPTSGAGDLSTVFSIIDKNKYGENQKLENIIHQLPQNMALSAQGSIHLNKSLSWVRRIEIKWKRPIK